MPRLQYCGKETAVLLNWLAKLFGFRTAVESRRENPVLAATVQRCSEIYQQTPLSQYINNATSDALAREHFLEINSVCNAADPVAACRENLVPAMLRYALFQVLVIPKVPEQDASGLRGLPGISGELCSHISELAQRNIALRAELHESPHFSDDTNLVALVKTEFWKSRWRLETLDAARRLLGDQPEVNDWYRPFTHAACANQENIYRIDLGMPSAFSDAEKRVAPTAYSLFTDIVVSGAADPLAEWLDYHAGMQVSMPGGLQEDAKISILKASNSE